MKKVYLSFADEDAQKVEDWISLLRSPDFDLDFYKGSLDTECLPLMDAPLRLPAMYIYKLSCYNT